MISDYGNRIRPGVSGGLGDYYQQPRQGVPPGQPPERTPDPSFAKILAEEVRKGEVDKKGSEVRVQRRRFAQITGEYPGPHGIPERTYKYFDWTEEEFKEAKRSGQYSWLENASFENGEILP